MNAEPQSQEKPAPSRTRWLLRAMIAAAAVVVGGLVLQFLKRSGWIEVVLSWMKNLGVWAPVIFIVIYIVAAVLFVPASVLTLGAGILFGLLWGSTYVLIGAMISAVISFLISRHFGRGWIVRRVARHPKFRALDDAVARDGWKIVALTRVTPGFPFSLVNYAFGLTGISTGKYFVASLAMIPSTFVFVYFGTLIGDVSGLRAGPPIPSWLKATLAFVAVLALACIARFARRAWVAASRSSEDGAAKPLGLPPRRH